MQEQLPAGWDGVSEFPRFDVVAYLPIEIAGVDEDEFLSYVKQRVEVAVVSYIIDNMVEYIEGYR